jgi:hypothetical protein
VIVDYNNFALWQAIKECGIRPPRLGGSAAGSAIVRRDQEIETAVGHVGNLGGAPRALVEFRSEGAAFDVSGWRSRHRSFGPSAQFPRSGIAKFAVNVCPLDTSKNTSKTIGCGGRYANFY